MFSISILKNVWWLCSIFIVWKFSNLDIHFQGVFRRRGFFRYRNIVRILVIFPLNFIFSHFFSIPHCDFVNWVFLHFKIVFSFKCYIFCYFYLLNVFWFLWIIFFGINFFWNFYWFRDFFPFFNDFKKLKKLSFAKFAIDESKTNQATPILLIFSLRFRNWLLVE